MRKGFVIVKSASSLNTWDNRLFEMAKDLRLEGFAETDISKAREIGALFNEMLSDKGESWTRLRNAIEVAKIEKWGKCRSWAKGTAGAVRSACIAR